MFGALSHDGAFFRRLAHLGARHGPAAWLRYSPPVFAVAFAVGLPERRRAVRENLRWVRGPVGRWQERREVLGTFVSYAHCLAEALAEGRPEAESCRISRRGSEHLEAELARGRGAILVTAHTGPWDVAARLLRDGLGADVVIAMTKEPDPRARAFHDAIRERSGVRVAHVGAHPVDALPLLRHLKNGGVVAAQLDRGAPSGRVLSVELFGRGFTVPEGPFRLAALAGVPIVPLFSRRLGHFEYEIVISPAIELARSAPPEALQRAAQVAVDAMGAFIRQSPTQWFQF